MFLNCYYTLLFPFKGSLESGTLCITVKHHREHCVKSSTDSGGKFCVLVLGITIDVHWKNCIFTVYERLKGYCQDNFAAFSSKLGWNYEPEPLFKTRNTSAITRGRCQKILQWRANQCLFLEIFPTHNDKT